MGISGGTPHGKIHDNALHGRLNASKRIVIAEVIGACQVGSVLADIRGGGLSLNSGGFTVAERIEVVHHIPQPASRTSASSNI
jgi:hypothetical protein